MNDSEFADLMGRATAYERLMGVYPENFYICYVCKAAGRVAGEATYLDYPNGVNLETKEVACFEHRNAPGVTPIDAQLAVGEVGSARSEA